MDIRSIRAELGKSQQDIAQNVGITRHYYSMIETGHRSPSVTVAQKIANELGIDWTLFFASSGHESLTKEA